MGEQIDTQKSQESASQVGRLLDDTPVKIIGDSAWAGEEGTICYKVKNTHGEIYRVVVGGISVCFGRRELEVI